VNTAVGGYDDSPQHSGSSSSRIKQQQSPKNITVDQSLRKQPSSSSTTSSTSPAAREADRDTGIVLSKKTVSAIAVDRERDREKDLAIMSLQQKLDHTSVEHAAVERNLRLEVDSLRSRLAVSSEQFLESVSAGNTTNSTAAGPVGADVQTRLFRELSDSKRIIVHLEQEIGRLKDEAALQALRNHEELKYAKERAAAQFEEAERSHQSEMQTIETRHDLALQALKKVYLENNAFHVYFDTYGKINTLIVY